MKKKIGLRAKRNIIAVVLVSLFISLFTMGCSDEDYEDYEEYAEYEDEDEDEDFEDADFEDEEYEDVEKSSDSADSSYNSRDFLSDEDYPKGTGDTLDGKIVVVSIFLNDNTTSWDFNSQEDLDTVTKLSRNMGIGMDWIVEQGKKYGKNIEFIYNWDNDSELFNVIDIDCDFSKGESQTPEVKMLLDENFLELSNKLLDRYNAENIFYAMYLNEKPDTKMTCHAMPYYGTELGFNIPYEAVCLSNWVYGEEQGPASYAHEILHIFGAPDYYVADTMGENHGITQEFVDYCANSDMINEIMTSTYDPYTNTIPKDSVTNDLSELTAYYLGWTDSCSLLDEFGLARDRQ